MSAGTPPSAKKPRLDSKATAHLHPVWTTVLADRVISEFRSFAADALDKRPDDQFSFFVLGAATVTPQAKDVVANAAPLQRPWDCSLPVLLEPSKRKALRASPQAARRETQPICS